jgi:hypothetical protein
MNCEYIRGEGLNFPAKRFLNGISGGVAGCLTKNVQNYPFEERKLRYSGCTVQVKLID